MGKCCLSGTSIWDKRGWWGLRERAQPCPHAPASGEPRWPQPTEHSSCSETAAPCGTRGCPAVPWLEHKAPSVPQLWESQREGPCRYNRPAAIKIPKPAATGLELTPHSPSHTIITTRCTGQTGWRQKSFKISLYGAHSNIFCYQHPPTPQGFFLRLPTQFSSTICQCYLLQH